MFQNSEYLHRGTTFLHNRMFPSKKRLSTLMLYATDLCDSACKHCLIWAKRPVSYLDKHKIFDLITSNKLITKHTRVGLEGGEFLLHPDALEIMEWFSKNHPLFDLFSNCLKPESVIEAVNKFPPDRLYISLDGTKKTYQYMRGKDGYDGVLKVIEATHDKLPVAVMFTLSPYNDFSDLAHVAEICKKFNVDLRVGVYNNVAFFDTLEKAHETNIGEEKKETQLKFGDVKKLAGVMEATREMKRHEQEDIGVPKHNERRVEDVVARSIPPIVKQFKENYDYLVLYDEWRKKNLHIKCYSILDSIVVLPNGDVPICQNLDLKLGNVFIESLDEIFNKAETQKLHDHYVNNCNQCWMAFHRKYDVALYRTFEKNFGQWATNKMLGYHQWTDDANLSYKAYFSALQSRLNHQDDDTDQ
ncbi:MAG: radical SAM protein [Chitinophagaceae bacterium]